MVKLKIVKVYYENEYPDDELSIPEVNIQVKKEDKAIVKLHTPNLSRTESLVKTGYYKEGKTLDVPIKTLPDGRIYIDPKFEIQKTEEYSKKSIQKMRNKLRKLGIKHTGI